MADLGDALYRWICKRSPRTEPNSFGAAVGWFVKNAGGNVSAAARAAGVSRRTFRDWIAGSRPRDPERAAGILAAARAGERRQRLRPGREKRLRAMDPSDIALTATFNYDGTARHVEIGRYLIDDTINRLVDAFLDGASLDQLRETFVENIEGAQFYSDTLGLGEDHSHGWSVDGIDSGGGESDE